MATIRSLTDVSTSASPDEEQRTNAASTLEGRGYWQPEILGRGLSVRSALTPLGEGRGLLRCPPRGQRRAPLPTKSSQMPGRQPLLPRRGRRRLSQTSQAHSQDRCGMCPKPHVLASQAWRGPGHAFPRIFLMKAPIGPLHELRCGRHSPESAAAAPALPCITSLFQVPSY